MHGYLRKWKLLTRASKLNVEKTSTINASINKIELEAGNIVLRHAPENMRDHAVKTHEEGS